MPRLKLRENGTSHKKVVLVAEPVTVDTLFEAALKAFPRDTAGHSSSARFFLGHEGDEIDDAALLEKDDIVWVSFDGSDFAGDAITTVVAAPVATAATPALPKDLSSPSRKSGSKFAVFVSHAKADAAMEARFVQSWLQERLGAPCFIDSDDLRDLNQLTAHVKNSQAIVLIQSKSVLTRPFCLIELLTAVQYGIPIIGLCLVGVGVRAQYDYAEAAHFLTHLDSELEESPGTLSLLAEHGYDDLVEAAYLLSTTLPKNISIPLEPGGSSSAINATLERLVGLLQAARPVPLDDLPKQEAWLRGRTVKAWGSWSEALADHVTFTSLWPSMLGAYIGPHAIEASCIEAVMLTVNSVNACPFCSGLHLDLGRMAGLSDPNKLNSAKSTDDSVSHCGAARNRPAVAYARTFAMADGRGKRDVDAFDTLVAAVGPGQAASVRALCWLLYWGSYAGNTLNGAIGFKPPKPGASALFQVTFLVWYSVLYFGGITAVSAVLKLFPAGMPRWFMALLGTSIAALAGCFFVPLGMMGKLVGTERKK